MRVKNAAKCSPAAKSPNLAELTRDYKTATEQYGVIVRYLHGAMEVLPKPECQLLLDLPRSRKTTASGCTGRFTIGLRWSAWAREVARRPRPITCSNRPNRPFRSQVAGDKRATGG